MVGAERAGARRLGSGWGFEPPGILARRGPATYAGLDRSAGAGRRPRGGLPAPAHILVTQLGLAGRLSMGGRLTRPHAARGAEGARLASRWGAKRCPVPRGGRKMNRVGTVAIEWLTDVDAALALAKAERRPTLAYFSAAPT